MESSRSRKDQKMEYNASIWEKEKWIDELGDNLSMHWNSAKTPVLVYQIGKVGSKSVMKSIEPIVSLGYFPLHIHNLSPKLIRGRYERLIRSNRSIDNSLIWSVKLSRFVEKNRYSFDWKVITMVRDIVAMAFSSFFQNFQSNYENMTVTDAIHQGKSMFLKRLVYAFKGSIESVDVWFDRELKEIFGVDLLNTDLILKDGYCIVGGENVDVLLIRLENLNDCFPIASRELFGVSFHLRNDNLSSKKSYADDYIGLKQIFCIPDYIANAVYDSRVMDKFYNRGEIRSFKQRWSYYEGRSSESYCGVSHSDINDAFIRYW